MKTMQKESRGRDFRGLVSYLFSRDSHDKAPGRLIAGNMASSTPESIIREFQAARARRPEIEKAVFHNNLRLPSGERISDEQWASIAHDFMRELGFTQSHPWVAVQHDDSEGQHIHLAASRIGFDGSLWHGKNSNLIATRIAHDLEKKYGLTITRGTDGIEPPATRKPTSGELGRAIRTNTLPPRLIIQRAIDRAMLAQPSLEDLISDLELDGIEVRINQSQNGINGLSFGLSGQQFSGSKLGGRYKWNELKKGLKNEQSNEHSQPTSTATKHVAADRGADRANREATGFDPEKSRGGESKIRRISQNNQGGTRSSDERTGGSEIQKNQNFLASIETDKTVSDNRIIHNNPSKGIKAMMKLTPSTTAPTDALDALRDHIDSALIDIASRREAGETIANGEFQRILEAAGIEMGTRVENGELLGFAFKPNGGQWAPAKALGGEYSMPGLVNRGLVIADNEFPGMTGNQMALRRLRQAAGQRRHYENDPAMPKMQSHEAIGNDDWGICKGFAIEGKEPGEIHWYLSEREFKSGKTPAYSDHGDKLLCNRTYDERAVLLMLRDADRQWGGGFELFGTDEFKSRAEFLMKQHGLGQYRPIEAGIRPTIEENGIKPSTPAPAETEAERIEREQTEVEAEREREREQAEEEAEAEASNEPRFSM